MYVYDTGAFRNVLRVFAAKINTSTFTPLGTGFPSFPYAGTQAGLNIAGSKAGRIIVDDSGNPVRRVDGRFFTTESDFFVNGSPVNTIRLEANVLTGTAIQPIAKFQVVKYVDFGQIAPCTYDDIGETAVAMLMENLTTGQTGTVVMQGTIVNPAWSWTVVGALLWSDDTGALTDVDPHVANAFVYPTSRVPVARVLSPTSIFFDQGLGGKGDKGESGDVLGVELATTTVFGISKLSTPAADVGNPIVVGDNDPRLSNKVLKAGDTMTGNLVMSGGSTKITLPNAPIVGTDAANKTYVDTKVSKAGDTMTGLLVLSGDPVAALGAATKQYVDGKVSKAGDTMTGLLILSGDPVTALGAATKQYVDNKVPRFQRIIASAAQTVVNTTINLQSSAAPLLRIQVFLNGILQIEGAGESFTVTGATQITFLTPLALNDDVVVVSYVL
jgi:hypothetical protein